MGHGRGRAPPLSQHSLLQTILQHRLASRSPPGPAALPPSGGHSLASHTVTGSLLDWLLCGSWVMPGSWLMSFTHAGPVGQALTSTRLRATSSAARTEKGPFLLSRPHLQGTAQLWERGHAAWAGLLHTSG